MQITELYQSILDKAIKSAISSGLDKSHMENLYAVSVLYLKDGRYNFVKWLRQAHADMIKDNALILPLPINGHLYFAHKSAFEVFKLAGVHGGIIHCTSPLQL